MSIDINAIRRSTNPRTRMILNESNSLNNLPPQATITSTGREHLATPLADINNVLTEQTRGTPTLWRTI